MKIPILIALAAAALAGQTYPGLPGQATVVTNQKAAQAQEIKVPDELLVRLYKNVAEWMNIQRNYETTDMKIRGEIEKWCSDHHASVGESHPDAAGKTEMTCLAKPEVKPQPK